MKAATIKKNPEIAEKLIAKQAKTIKEFDGTATSKEVKELEEELVKEKEKSSSIVNMSESLVKKHEEEMKKMKPIDFEDLQVIALKGMLKDEERSRASFEGHCKKYRKKIRDNKIEIGMLRIREIKANEFIDILENSCVLTDKLNVLYMIWIGYFLNLLFLVTVFEMYKDLIF